jgi:hypothetical protein
MTVQGEATRITLLVTQTLERLDIPYAVGGSLASSLHGVMRSTLDVDIVKVFMSPALKIPSLPSSNGIAWAAKSQTGNGVISSVC